MKELISQLFVLLGYLTLFEEHCCDVLAWKCRPTGRMRRVGIEAERSMRNLVPNTTRDLSGGCDAVLSFVPDDALAAAVRRKLRRDLPREQWTKVGVVTISQVQRAIQRLQTKNANCSKTP